MDIIEMLKNVIDLGEVGVGLAQLITMLNPASWWASGILYLIEMGLQALGAI